MAHGRGYDRGYGYDRGLRGEPPRGYDRGFGRARYDRGYGAGRAPEGVAPPLLPFPFVPFGYDPMMGPMAWPVPYPRDVPVHRGYDRGHRVPPRQSPTYGRGGDRALRAWADRFGYDVEFSIPPRRWPRR